MPVWLSNIGDRFVDSTAPYIGNILGALAILIIGWVIAVVARSVIRGALSRTGLDEKLADYFRAPDGKPGARPATWIGQAVYYVIMVMVVIGFLEALKLEIITAPLNDMVNKVLQFAPNVLSAAVLLVLAVVLARVLKAVVAKVLDATNLEERMARSAGMDEDRKPSLSGPLSNAVYWLVLLLFLPTILESLSLQGLLEPVLDMFKKVFDFIPNILAAAIIVLVGWFVATIVRKVVVGLLTAANVDGLSERLGLNKILGQQSISGLIGLIVYVFILIPTVVSGLNALKIDAVARPATQMLTTLMDAIPNIFAASVIVILAAIVGKFVGGLIAEVLGNIGFDRIFAGLGLCTEEQEGTCKPSEVAGYLAMAYIVLFAAIEAAGLLGFAGLEEIIMTVMAISARIIFGLVIIGLGLWAANLVSGLITQTGAPNSGSLAKLAKLGIVILVGAIGLRQMGLANEIVNTAFGLLMGAAAVAIAISFGLGGRDIAARQLESWTKSLKGEE